MARVDGATAPAAEVVVSRVQRVTELCFARDDARRADRQVEAMGEFIVWWQRDICAKHMKRAARLRRQADTHARAANRVQVAMRARRDAALAKRREAQSRSVVVARAVVQEVRVVEARAQAAYDAHVNRAIKRGREVCAVALALSDELRDREMKRQRAEWMDPAWNAVWSATWAAARASGNLPGIL